MPTTVHHNSMGRKTVVTTDRYGNERVYKFMLGLYRHHGRSDVKLILFPCCSDDFSHGRKPKTTTN